VLTLQSKGDADDVVGEQAMRWCVQHQSLLAGFQLSCHKEPVRQSKSSPAACASDNLVVVVLFSLQTSATLQPKHPPQEPNTNSCALSHASCSPFNSAAFTKWIMRWHGSVRPLIVHMKPQPSPLQPRPSFSQHHSFLSSDQLSIQSSRSSRQL